MSFEILIKFRFFFMNLFTTFFLLFGLFYLSWKLKVDEFRVNFHLILWFEHRRCILPNWFRSIWPNDFVRDVNFLRPCEKLRLSIDILEQLVEYRVEPKEIRSTQRLNWKRKADLFYLIRTLTRLIKRSSSFDMSFLILRQ